MSNKFVVSIPPFVNWTDARNALAASIQKVSDYVAALPPQTDMDNNRVTSVADPVQPQDAVTLKYLQANYGGVGAAVALPTSVGNWLAMKLTILGATVPAYINAPQGGVQIVSGGTNQPVSLTATGTGNIKFTTGGTLSVNGHDGISGTFALAKLTSGGANGSITITDGLVTALTAAT